MNYNVKDPSYMSKAALFAIRNWKEAGINAPCVSPIFAIEMFGGNVYVFKEDSNLIMCVLETNGEFGTVDYKDFTTELKKDARASDLYIRSLFPKMFVNAPKPR